MTSGRSQFAAKITCPICEQVGTVVWEEDDSLARLLQISGFHAEVGGTQSDDVVIICDHCDQIMED